MCIATTSRRQEISQNTRHVIIYRLPALLNDGNSVVYAIFLFETLQTALSGADLYYWFVSGFGKVDHLQDPYISAIDNPVMGSIITGTVQFFFLRIVSGCLVTGGPGGIA